MIGANPYFPLIHIFPRIKEHNHQSFDSPFPGKCLIIQADNKISGDFLVRKIWNPNFIFRALFSIEFSFGREPGEL
jgi:hypothetical protein